VLVGAWEAKSVEAVAAADGAAHGCEPWVAGKIVDGCLAWLACWRIGDALRTISLVLSWSNLCFDGEKTSVDAQLDVYLYDTLRL
jgi:hypothetical protein